MRSCLHVLLGLSALAMGCDGKKSSHSDPGANDASQADGITVSALYELPERALAGITLSNSETPAITLVTSDGTLVTGSGTTFDLPSGTTVSPLTAGTIDLLPTRGPSFVLASSTDLVAETNIYLLEKTNGSSSTHAVEAAGGPAQAAQLAGGGCVVDVVVSDDPDLVPAVVTLTASSGDVYSIAYDTSGVATATKTASGAASGLFVVANTTA